MKTSYAVTVLLAALLLAAPLSHAGEEPFGGGEEAGPAVEEKSPDFVSLTASEELKRKLEQRRAELDKKRQAEVAAFAQKIQAEFEEARKPNTITVTVDGRQIGESVREPQSPSEVKTVDSIRFRTWSLNPRDFKFDLPVEMFVPRMVGSRKIVGRDKVYLVLPFTVTNTLTYVDIWDSDDKLVGSSAVNSPAEAEKARAKAEKDGNKVKTRPAMAELGLRFLMVTDDDVFVPEASGFLAREAVEFSTFKRRAWTKEMISFVRKSELVGALKPGETRAGVAVFPRFDPETTSVRVLVEGLTNHYDFKRDLRKALILEFVRPGNVYYPGQVKLRFKRRVGKKLMDPKSGYLPERDEDVHRGFDWVWLWNWDVAAAASDPKLTEGVASPTGKEKFNFWSYKITVPNRTGQERQLTVERVRTMVKVSVNVAGKERVVEVPLIDDGKMNVYKAAFFDQETLPISEQRFPRDEKVAPGNDSAAQFTVVFREQDYDFEEVIRNVHNQLDLEAAAERNKEAKRTGKLFEGPRYISAKEAQSLRKQIEEKLPAAIKEQLAKKVCAELTVKSGLSSGVRTINFSLYKPVPLPPAPE
jgi:hypothetical protein